MFIFHPHPGLHTNKNPAGPIETHHEPAQRRKRPEQDFIFEGVSRRDLEKTMFDQNLSLKDLDNNCGKARSELNTSRIKSLASSAIFEQQEGQM